MGILINDGHTRKGRINAVAGLHEQLDFEFRPMLAADVEAFEGLLENKKPRQVVELIAGMVARQLVSWSEDVDPRKVEHVLRLPHPVLLRLRRIVQGTHASDPVDTLTSDEKAESLDEMESSLLAIVEAARGN